MMYRDPVLLMLWLGWAEAKAEAEGSWYKQKTEASQGAQAPRDSVVSRALHWSEAVSLSPQLSSERELQMSFSMLSPSWRAKAPNLSTPTGDLVESEQQSPSPSAQLINKDQGSLQT